jgi:serine/threonine protein phosphatase PrpC
MKYNYKSLTNVGKVRKANEDSCGEFKTSHGTLLIVCDGMGGHVGGAVASTTAVDKIHEYISSHDSSFGYQTLLHDALVFANHQVFGMAENQPELKGMGTTAVVVLISESGLVYHAHVGDSRLYLLRDQGIQRVTKDHSLVQLLVDQGQITEDEMETHPNKNQILKAIGTDFELRPEVCKEPLQMKENDILLICSDGLCGMVHDRDIARITYANISDLVNATQLLIDEANNNGGKDNITATLVTFGQPQDQKVLLAAPVSQNEKKPNNNKKWLLMGMGVLLLLLVAYFLFLRPVEKKQTYCECYKTLSDRIKNSKSDSEKIEIYNKGTKVCNENKEVDKSCKVSTELEKTIAEVKVRLEKEKGDKEDEEKGSNADDEKQKKEVEAEKNISEKNKRQNTAARCGTKHTHYVELGDKIDTLFDKYVKTCTKLKKGELIDANNKSVDLIAGKSILIFNCECN